jgi:hypothetical protein
MYNPAESLTGQRVRRCLHLSFGRMCTAQQHVRVTAYLQDQVDGGRQEEEHIDRLDDQLGICQD